MPSPFQESVGSSQNSDKEESSFSEEKEAKRLSFTCLSAESFLVLFFKKEHPSCSV